MGSRWMWEITCLMLKLILTTETEAQSWDEIYDLLDELDLPGFTLEKQMDGMAGGWTINITEYVASGRKTKVTARVTSRCPCCNDWGMSPTWRPENDKRQWKHCEKCGHIEERDKERPT